jgi:hypothetical protein
VTLQEAALSTADTPTPGTDPQAVVDLLGVLAYGELTAFDRLAEDARLAPTLTGRAALAGMAAAEIGHYERLRDRLTELGADAEVAMAPFAPVFDTFHARTKPQTWLEGLVKAYVGDGIAADFYREVAQLPRPADPRPGARRARRRGHADFAVREVRAAVGGGPALSGRLSLWARRLVGEALSQAQRVAAERDALAMLIVGGTGDLGALAALLKRITSAHTARCRPSASPAESPPRRTDARGF